MRSLAGLLLTGIVFTFLICAGCAGPVTPAPVPVETPVVTETTFACPEGATVCPDGSCRNTAADSHNCGGCGYICPVPFDCISYRCVNSDTGVVTTPYVPIIATATPSWPPRGSV